MNRDLLPRARRLARLRRRQQVAMRRSEDQREPRFGTLATSAYDAGPAGVRVMRQQPQSQRW